MRTAAIEFAKEGITVNAILSGNIFTEGFLEVDAGFQAATAAYFLHRRLGTYDDVASVALYRHGL